MRFRWGGVDPQDLLTTSERFPWISRHSVLCKFGSAGTITLKPSSKVFPLRPPAMSTAYAGGQPIAMESKHSFGITKFGSDFRYTCSRVPGMIYASVWKGGIARGASDYDGIWPLPNGAIKMHSIDGGRLPQPQRGKGLAVGDSVTQAEPKE